MIATEKYSVTCGAVYYVIKGGSNLNANEILNCHYSNENH